MYSFHANIQFCLKLVHAGFSYRINLIQNLRIKATTNMKTVIDTLSKLQHYSIVLQILTFTFCSLKVKWQENGSQMKQRCRLRAIYIFFFIGKSTGKYYK